LAGALGLGGPIGLGVGVAGWLVSRRVKRKVGERLADASADTPAGDGAEGLVERIVARVRDRIGGGGQTDEPSPRLVERIVELVRGFPVRVSEPPLPQVRGVDQRFTPYAVDAISAALSYANTEIVSTTPGAAGVLKRQKALIDQYQESQAAGGSA
jgi:hypothetical protein